MSVVLPEFISVGFAGPSRYASNVSLSELIRHCAHRIFSQHFDHSLSPLDIFPRGWCVAKSTIGGSASGITWLLTFPPDSCSDAGVPLLTFFFSFLYDQINLTGAKE